jgi:transposase
MKKTGRKFTADLKAQVALEALQEREALAALSVRFEVQPNQDLPVEAGVYRELSESIFRGGRERKRRAGEPGSALCQNRWN